MHETENPAPPPPNLNLKPITSGVKASLSGDGHRASRDVFSHCIRLITKLSYLTWDFFLLAKLNKQTYLRSTLQRKRQMKWKPKAQNSHWFLTSLVEWVLLGFCFFHQCLLLQMRGVYSISLLLTLALFLLFSLDYGSPVRMITTMP